jgi:hypothetical protein
MNIKNRSRRLLGVTVAALSIGACDFISPIESNPNAVATASVDQLFTGIQVNSFFLATGGLSRISAIWTQQMAGTDRQFVAFDNYIIGEEDFEDEFDAAYTQGGLVDIRAAIAAAEDAGRLPYAGILKIHEAYMMGLIASFYGDIPYSEAVNPDIETPVLDDQAAVYAALQALLTEAIANLGGTGAGPGAVDMAFQGNTARWIAVANTLKARYHMHWGEVSGNAAYTAARTAALAGITANAGSWRARFGASATENNMWYQFQRDRSGYISAGDFLVPLMVANSDPRLPFYFSESSPGVYTPRASGLSSSATGFGGPAFRFPMVTCAENYFILAEAESRLGSADAVVRTAANNALACEEAMWGVDLSARKGVINGLSGAALRDEVMRQKYIAMFLNPEAFNDYKRACRPAITERPSGMPGRVFYSSNERRTNPNIPPTGTAPNGKYNDNDPTRC